MIKTLIFDLGNVLLFFDHTKMIDQIASICSVKPSLVKKIISDDALAPRYEKGEISSHHLFDLLQAHSESMCTHQELARAGSDIFTPNTLLINHLSAFKKQNIRLVLLSNIVDMHMDHIMQTYSFLNLFDELILSYKVGLRKPEAAIYKLALEAAQCDKDVTLFIDDMKENIEGAKKIGIPTHHFIDTNKFLDHLLIRGLITEKKLTLHAH